MKKKIIIISLIAVLVIVIAGFVISTIYVRKTVVYNGTVSGNVAGEVMVTRDQNGIPSIQAQSMEDAYYALGFLHAQDRLILMEYYRAVASGRLGALIGQEGLAMDKLTRLCRFRKDAGDLYEKLDEKHKKYLLQYAEGVNLIRKREMSEIIEMSRFPAEGWTPGDVLSVLFLLDWAQSFHNNREQVFLLNESENSRVLRLLMPENLTYYYNEDDRNNVLLLKELKNTVRRYVGTFCEGFGFYIPPRFTGENSALSGYTYDSDASTYTQWYPVHIKAGDVRISALTAAGLPFLFAGEKSSFSYSVFNPGLDVQDYYIERIKKQDSDTFFYNRGRWDRFTEENITLPLRNGNGEAASIPCTLRYKDRHPVISDIFSDTINASTVSMVFPRPGREYIYSLFEIPNAETINDGRRLTANMSSVPKVYLFSSKEQGMITYAGVLPFRNVAQRIFQKGENFGNGTPEIQLGTYTASSGRDILVTGSSMYDNEPGVIKNFEFFKDTLRLGRLKKMLQDNSAWEPRHVKSMLLDTYSMIAEKFVPVIYTMLDDVSITSGKLTRIYFKNWNYRMETDSVPASIVQVVMAHMLNATMKDELRDEAYTLLDNHYYLMENLYRIFSDDTSPIFDNVATKKKFETRKEVFERAFHKTLMYLTEKNGPKMENWHWGNIHSGSFDLLVGGDDSYLRDNFLKTEKTAFPGDDSSLNMGTVRFNKEYRCGKVSAVSVVHSKEGSHISQAFGVSMNPFSEFTGIFVTSRSFSGFVDTSPRHTMRIVPEGN
ncbi:MAG TPA: penicillin acylase family protein [Spirochaetota bacterium]|nr:penicillin acylase family protein [Spirochaetota bacterium]